MSTTIASETKRAAQRERRRVLVVVDESCFLHGLCPAVGRGAAPDAVEALVIAPAHGSAAAGWYVDEDAARADATHRLRACVSCLAGDGIHAEGRLADPDPVQAISDALFDFDADEILLVTAPQRPSTWLRQNAIDRLRRSFRLPIEHLVVAAEPTEASPRVR